MKKKKPIIITTAVIILCIITLILGIKVVQKKKEVQTKQELIQSQEELINYIKNDGMNVENKDIYTARIEKTTTEEELDPIKEEYEKEAEELREAIEEEKAELIEKIVERGYLGEEEVSKYTTELKEIRTNEEYEKKKVEIEEAERQKEVEVKEQAKEEISKTATAGFDISPYLEMADNATTAQELENIIREKKEAEEQHMLEVAEKVDLNRSSESLTPIASTTTTTTTSGGSSSTSESSSSDSESDTSTPKNSRIIHGDGIDWSKYNTGDGGFNFR